MLPPSSKREQGSLRYGQLAGFLVMRGDGMVDDHSPKSSESGEWQKRYSPGFNARTKQETLDDNLLTDVEDLRAV